MDAIVISLTKGKATVVDAECWDRVYMLTLADGTVYEGTPSGLTWYANKSRNTFYATSNWKQRQVLMHRLLLCAPAGTLVDHRDRDGLNNRMDNLRFATTASNGWNSRHPGRNRFRGVYATRGKYAVSFNFHGKVIRLGTFADEIDAARAYDAAALKHFGEFARLNFPMECVGS